MRTQSLSLQAQRCACAILLLSLMVAAAGSRLDGGGRRISAAATTRRRLTKASNNRGTWQKESISYPQEDRVQAPQLIVPHIVELPQLLAATQDERGLLEEVERVQIRFEYMFFPDADFASLESPTREIYKGVACQTDAFITQILQDQLQATVRVSLQILEWSFDASRDRPMDIFFQVEAFYDEKFVYDKRIKAAEVILAMNKAVFEDYVTNYVWQTNPLMGTTADVVRNINRLAYDVQAVFVPAEVATSNVLYDTHNSCLASSKVRSSWQFGFYDGVLEGSITPLTKLEDIQAVSCQIRYFLESFLSEQNYGAKVSVDLRNLEWEYNLANDFEVTVNLDMTAMIQHNNGDITEMHSQTLSEMAKTAHLIDFILEYVHKTQTESQFASVENSVFLDVQKVQVDAMVLDAAPEDSGNTGEWTSEQCRNFAPTDTPTSLPTMAPTTRGQATEGATAAPTSGPQGAIGESGAVTNIPANTSGEMPTFNPSIFDDGAAQGTEFLGWCRMALYAADEDRNRRLGLEEYIDLLNTVGANVYEGYPFVALPMVLKVNFDSWTSSSSGEIDLEAELMPSENSNNITMSELSPSELQQARRDVICEVTEKALLKAAADPALPRPVRLDINTTFLTLNQAGVSSTDDFWKNSTNIQAAFAIFVEDFAMNAMDDKLMGPSEEGIQRRQVRGRRLNTDSANDQYWVLPETADLWQVQGTRCPLDSPFDASCLLATTTYEIFVLTHNVSDSLNTNAIAAAAHNATEEGIADGSLQNALETINPATIWTLEIDPTPKETNAPTSAPTIYSTLVPTTPVRVTDTAGNENPSDIDFDEETYSDSDGVGGSATQVSSKNQCGGDMGLQALEFMNTSCDSFLGRHIWTIVAISFLFLALLCLFLPVCLCGGYPCCPGKKPDKISSGATRCTVSVDPSKHPEAARQLQKTRGGRRPKVSRQNSGLSSLSSGISDFLGMGDRRSNMRRQNSGISSISSGFSGVGGRAAPRRGRRPDMNRQASGLSALSDDFDDEEEMKARGKRGRENKEEQGGHAEPWFYPEPERAATGKVNAYDDVTSNDEYQYTDPPRRGIPRTNSYDSCYSGVSGERTSLY